MLFPDQPDFSEGLRQIPADALPFSFRTGAGLELILGLPEPSDPAQPLADAQLDDVAGGQSTFPFRSAHSLTTASQCVTDCS